MVAITGNVNLSLLGKDSFQEVDIAGITMPITKHNFIIRDVVNLLLFSSSIKIAQEGRPGPVLIDIPKILRHKSPVCLPRTRADYQIEKQSE